MPCGARSLNRPRTRSRNIWRASAAAGLTRRRSLARHRSRPTCRSRLRCRRPTCRSRPIRGGLRVRPIALPMPPMVPADPPLAASSARLHRPRPHCPPHTPTSSGALRRTPTRCSPTCSSPRPVRGGLPWCAHGEACRWLPWCTRNHGVFCVVSEVYSCIIKPYTAHGSPTPRPAGRRHGRRARR